jgi:hypothetical protein
MYGHVSSTANDRAGAIRREPTLFEQHAASGRKR